VVLDGLVVVNRRSTTVAVIAVLDLVPGRCPHLPERQSQVDHKTGKVARFLSMMANFRRRDLIVGPLSQT
jgi:hypothetical protein